MIGILIRRSGELCLGALLVSILSGFLVAYQYDVGSPFYSTVYMDSLLPFGAFFRSLHFWSSQAFFISLLWHVFKNVPRKGDHKSTGSGFDTKWIVLTSTLFLAIYALFSGYILRFDQTGRDAAQIAEHLFLSIPYLGEVIDRLLLALKDEGLNRVYAVHIFLSFLLWLLGTWYHLGRTILRLDTLMLALTISMAISVVLKAPLDPKDVNLMLVKGPWFFLGVQELLRFLPPFWAGIVFPSIPLGGVALLGVRKTRNAAIVTLCGWGVIYGILTMIGIIR